ncbi:MAG: hypothetical protein Q8R55_03965 [Candidatus Taylorbacteria bacterium]|nr:hypothetical protein [Candidatus Taylorbacteria bacterium]
MLSEKSLQEFKKIWSEEFSEDISDKQAASMGVGMLTLFNHVYRPVKKDWLGKNPDYKNR